MLNHFLATGVLLLLAITPLPNPSVDSMEPPEQIEQPAPDMPQEIDTASLEALSNTASGWGQGARFDDLNRPLTAVEYQQLYGQYDAYFIGEQSNTIYLTFDEGYENGYTEKILDVLQEKQCSAVFFVTLPYVKSNPQLVQRMIEQGHVIGNHSVTHPSAGLPSQSLEKQTSELMDLHQYMLDNFNYTMYLFRYPAGIYSPQSLALVQQLGYKSVFWSFAYRDWITDDQPEQTQALQKLKDRVHPGAIYLLHAVSATNTAILGDFIDSTRQQGYVFDTLPQS